MQMSHEGLLSGGSRLFLAAVFLTVPVFTQGCGARRNPGSGAARNSSVASSSRRIALSPFPAATVHIGAGRTFEKSGGRLVWEMSTGPVDVALGSQTGHVNRVLATFYQSGKPGLQLRAPDASVDYQAKTIVLDQGVEVRSLMEPARFASDRVEWQWSRPDGLAATGHVRFQRGLASVTAGRLDGDTTLRQVRLTEHPAAFLQRGA